MYPTIIAADGTITVMVGNQEHTVAPKSPNYDELLYCIENELWETVPSVLEDRAEAVVADLDFNARESMTREEAIGILEESIPDAQKFADMLKELGIPFNYDPDQLTSYSNDELREALKNIGIDVNEVTDK